MNLHTIVAYLRGGTRPEACERCAFGNQEPGTELHCIRHAPQAIGIPTPGAGGLPLTVYTYWPMTKPGQWCGDFVPKPQCVN